MYRIKRRIKILLGFLYYFPLMIYWVMFNDVGSIRISFVQDYFVERSEVIEIEVDVD